MPGTEGSRSPTRFKQYHEIERRESQLWWLAVMVVMLLALALLAIDASHSPAQWFVSPQLSLALNMRAVRIALILTTLVICAYFRDSARRLRRENSMLITDLDTHSRQLERKNHEVSRLKDLSDQLIGLTDMRRALDLVLGMAVEIVGADTASVMLRAKDSDVLSVVASRGLSPDVVKSTRVKIGESIAGRVAQDGKAVILNSDELTGEMAKRARRGDSIVSSAILPITVGGSIRGVVSTAKRRGGECFTEEDMGVLLTLTNQASLVIQRTDLLDDLRSQVEKLASAVKELRQTRAELMHSEKLASIGQLAGGVAHEINNPLQVILSRTQLMLASESRDAKLRDLQSLLEHTTRIADIVSNLLSFSRQNANTEFRSLDVNAVVKRTMDLLEPQMTPDDVQTVLELENGFLPSDGNAGQLQQVFTNIALNAYQSMREQGGGTLTVRTRMDANTVEVEFADTGPGIPHEYVDRLFEPFFTTKPDGEGTGLGLSIAYGIIQSHGGSIAVTSSDNKGTCFMVSLPIKQTNISCKEQTDISVKSTDNPA